MLGWRSARVTSISRMKISCAPSSTTIRGSMTLSATGGDGSPPSRRGEVDGTHAALAEEPLDRVGPDRRSRRGAGVLGLPLRREARERGRVAAGPRR